MSLVCFAFASVNKATCAGQLRTQIIFFRFCCIFSVFSCEKVKTDFVFHINILASAEATNKFALLLH